MKLITYHYNKSTGVGGVEVLIRELQEIAYREGYEVIELYCKVSGSDIREERGYVNYVSVFFMGFLKGRIFSLMRRLLLYLKINEIDSSLGDCIFVFDPVDVLFIPSKKTRECKLILVQTNKIDFFYSSWISRAALFLKGGRVFIHTVYTEKDKKALEIKLPFFKGIIKVLPRGCKIKTKVTVADFKFNRNIVSISRINESQKNFKGMVDIIKYLPSDYSLDLYGDGNEEEILKLMKLINGCPRIRFRGVAVNIEEILSYYSVFIMTSNYEGFGQTLIEARSQGLPIVAYNSFESLSWIVRNGENGYIVDKGDVVSFSKRIIEITSDKSIYERFSSRAISLSKETDMSTINKEWEKIIFCK